MKIILSPSKTKKIVEILDDSNLSIKTKKLISTISNMDIKEISKKFKLKEDKSTLLKDFYKNFHKKPCGFSIFTYNGLVYKNANISKKDMEYINEHLRILSALYGILKPLDKIKEYRLDLDNGIVEKDYWKDEILKELEGEEIINLASNEYTKDIKLKMTNIHFVNKIQIKKARGIFLRLLIDNNIKSIEELKKMDCFSSSKGNDFYFELDV